MVPGCRAAVSDAVTRLKLFVPLLAFAVLAPLLYWGLGRDPSAMPTALKGKPIPAFTLPSLTTPDAELDQALFAGQVSLLNVWATWCPSCRIEHPYLMQLAEQGVPVFGLNYKDEGEPARRWLKDLGNPYREVIFDSSGRLGLDLGVFGAPETYLVDSRGIVRARHVGVLDERVWQKEFAALYQSLQNPEER